MKITVLSGGVGGARFTRGLLRLLAACPTARRHDRQVTVVANTGDDMWLHGVRVCPDLDTLMYTLGGAVHEEQGWGRRDECRARQRRPRRVRPRLGLVHARRPRPGDAPGPDRAAAPRAAAVAGHRPAAPSGGAPGVRLLPMTDDEVETHVVDRRTAGRCTSRSGGCGTARPCPRAVRAGRPRDGAPPAPGRARGDRGRRRGRACRRPTRWSPSARSSRSPASATRCARPPRRSSGVSPIDRRRARARDGRRVPDRDRRRDQRGRRRAALRPAARTACSTRGSSTPSTPTPWRCSPRRAGPWRRPDAHDGRPRDRGHRRGRADPGRPPALTSGQAEGLVGGGSDAEPLDRVEVGRDVDVLPQRRAWQRRPAARDRRARGRRSTPHRTAGPGPPRAAPPGASSRDRRRRPRPPGRAPRPCRGRRRGRRDAAPAGPRAGPRPPRPGRSTGRARSPRAPPR